MILVSGITSDKIDEVWILCKEYIEMGNNKSKEEMNIDDIYERLKKAEMQLWVIFDEENDCVAMETACRKGFIKKLNKYGYEHAYTILGKDLTTIH